MGKSGFAAAPPPRLPLGQPGPPRAPPATINTTPLRASPHSSLATRAERTSRVVFTSPVLVFSDSRMKAITAVCATGASVPAIASGRVQRHREGENAEIQMYLSKLQDLVPFMPKNRKISKLEVIQHVIDYICDLQSALENHPAVGDFDAESALASPPCAAAPRARQQRRPLGPRSAPNTILRQISSSQEHRNQNMEKLDQPDRPSC